MALQQDLEAAAAGLLMMSESEHPFTFRSWPDAKEPLAGPALVAKLGLPADTPVETVSLDHFFRNVAEPKDWHDEGQAKQVAGFAKLKAALQAQLPGVQVFRIGSGEVTALLLGTPPGGGWAGLETKLIET